MGLGWVLPPSIVRGPSKGYIQPYYNYYPTVSEGGSTQGLGSKAQVQVTPTPKQGALQLYVTLIVFLLQGVGFTKNPLCPPYSIAPSASMTFSI